MHVKFCEDSLGVQTRTTNAGLRFEHFVLNDMHDSSKLKALSIMRNSLVIEDYLLPDPSLPNRTTLTKFRISNHNIMTIRGRYESMQIGDRACPFCPDQVEKNTFLDKMLYIQGTKRKNAGRNM